ncbi:MAG: type II toxin-antitoxin system HicB family antitoxin [Chlorobi bacterium]|nr:type II toxin-antitoxin system HicB family antitoxin [Chlorobiota bacterium]
MNQPVIIYPSPEGGYVAEIPSFPGCLAQGETIEECLAELAVVAELWQQTADTAQQPLLTTEAAIERMRTWSLAG